MRRPDVSDSGAAGSLIAGDRDVLGPITALAASAGVLRDAPPAFVDDDWHTVLRVHVDDVHHVCRAVVEEMPERRHDAVVTCPHSRAASATPGRPSTRRPRPG